MLWAERNYGAWQTAFEKNLFLKEESDPTVLATFLGTSKVAL